MRANEFIYESELTEDEILPTSEFVAIGGRVRKYWDQYYSSWSWVNFAKLREIAEKNGDQHIINDIDTLLSQQKLIRARNGKWFRNSAAVIAAFAAVVALLQPPKGATVTSPAQSASSQKQDTGTEQPQQLSKKENILKDIDTMATIIYSNYKLGWERGQTLSFMKQQGWLNGQRLEMAQNIANLAYSMPKGYWTTDEFRAIVRKEIAPNIPDNL